MRVVLAHGADASAFTLGERLAHCTGERVEPIVVESLSAELTRWQQRLGSAEVVELELADGRRLRSGAISGVLNRMLQAPGSLMLRASPDANYAMSEMSAFSASWVRKLSACIVNEPTPQGLCGRWRSTLAWRSLALSAGLPIERLELDSSSPQEEPPTSTLSGSRNILAIGGDAFGANLGLEIRAAIKTFARLADTPLLGLRFSGSRADGVDWRFLDATPYPDLSTAGDDAVRALAKLL